MSGFAPNRSWVSQLRTPRGKTCIIKVEWCSNDRFYINAIDSSVRTAMMEHWTTPECPTTGPQQMWKSTWLASGTCSGENATVFFNTGLDIAKQANVPMSLGVFANMIIGIVPSDTKRYRLDNVRKALQKSVGKNVAITCNKNHDGNSQIHNALVCANQEESALIDCRTPTLSAPKPLLSLSSPQACSSTLLTKLICDHLEMVV